MITLSHKQIEDILYLSRMAGGKPVQVESVWHSYGTRYYAYIHDRGWEIPKMGKIRELASP